MTSGLDHPAFSDPSAWTISVYTEMLSTIQEVTRRRFTSDWAQPATAQAAIYLRHDVDFSLECALEMAEEEHAAGVLATYFIEVECPFYNVLSATATRHVRQIAKMGHPVGLHLVLPQARGGSAGDPLNAQLRALQSVLDGVLVDVVSLHQPARHDDVAGRLHVPTTYDSMFFDQETYLSDSAGQWGSSTFRWLSKLTDHQGPGQLLIHPLWWTQPGETPQAKLERLLDLVRDAAEVELKQFRAWSTGDRS